MEKSDLVRLTAWLFSVLVLVAGEDEDVEDLFGLDYSQIRAPKGIGGGPVLVQIGIHFLNVKVDEDSQTLQFDCYLRTVWQDQRIIVPHNASEVQLDTAIVSRLWVPNTFFVHVQSVTRPMLLSDASGIILYQNKTVSHSSLYLTKYTCNLDYHKYPMDTQRCVVRIQSYGYTNISMILGWHFTGISWDKDIRMRSFELVDMRTLEPSFITFFDGSYSELSFEVLLARKVRNSVLSVYVPSTMLIIVSWLSLWVPPKLVPGRMVLAITTLLTLTGLFNANVSQSMPEVSYVKALDVWILACIVFVFGTIVEYIVVLRLFYDGDQTAPSPDKRAQEVSWTECRKWSGVEKAGVLEKVSRALSPVMFLIFNVVYWGYYLTTD
ncbi:gamma-aminobutyric acid receptor subunit beta-2-like isoform X1 [Amphibalanus amphitrite]|uniref:gamma-aminobutyric acid receptor subunit beta-2-like isoform X1 n=1 Tax=Amphibalanus amphitrite TaxID=1232801 RepID=UPI001C905B6D|nr:gamma-aminobutyric acid receptor subunit beta-2-like isoform X1 [Amphibalanus amphitrite]